MLFITGTQNRFDLIQGGQKMFFYRSIGLLFGQLGAQQQGGSFFLREHHRRQAVSFHHGITTARFPDYRHTAFIQRLHIPIYRAQADVEAISNFLRCNPFFTLQVGENGVQSVYSVQDCLWFGVSSLRDVSESLPYFSVTNFSFFISTQAPFSFNKLINSSTAIALSTLRFTISFPLYNVILPGPLPTYPKSASAISPGPFTIQPMMAIFTPFK